MLVPQADVYDARIQLSGEGLPSQGSDGYGILDKQSLSTSQFQEQTSYKRAIEGELEKTIEALDSVDDRRRARRDAAGGAVLHRQEADHRLGPRRRPTPARRSDPEQVQAIVHLVASSVEGLDPKQVTVDRLRRHGALRRR